MYTFSLWKMCKGLVVCDLALALALAPTEWTRTLQTSCYVLMRKSTILVFPWEYVSGYLYNWRKKAPQVRISPNQMLSYISSNPDGGSHLLLLWFPVVSLSLLNTDVQYSKRTPQTISSGGPPDKDPIITYQESPGVIKDLCRLLQVENINE